MEIMELIAFIENNPDAYITRGTIIDYISEKGHDWIMVLKALLIKNTDKYISKTYLLDKLDFMKRNSKQPHAFLDWQGTLIYNNLRE